jgi:hypothetical protein
MIDVQITLWVVYNSLEYGDCLAKDTTPKYFKNLTIKVNKDNFDSFMKGAYVYKTEEITLHTHRKSDHEKWLEDYDKNGRYEMVSTFTDIDELNRTIVTLKEQGWIKESLD